MPIGITSGGLYLVVGELNDGANSQIAPGSNIICRVTARNEAYAMSTPLSTGSWTWYINYWSKDTLLSFPYFPQDFSGATLVAEINKITLSDTGQILRPGIDIKLIKAGVCGDDSSDDRYWACKWYMMPKDESLEGALVTVYRHTMIAYERSDAATVERAALSFRTMSFSLNPYAGKSDEGYFRIAAEGETT